MENNNIPNNKINDEHNNNNNVEDNYDGDDGSDNEDTIEFIAERRVCQDGMLNIKCIGQIQQRNMMNGFQEKI